MFSRTVSKGDSTDVKSEKSMFRVLPSVYASCSVDRLVVFFKATLLCSASDVGLNSE